MSGFQRLKERKLVQWAVAYLGGAWLLIEVFATLREELGWASSLFPILAGVLAVGFVVTLVLAWYHGEQGRQRVSGPELLILGGIMLVAALLLPGVFGSDRPDGGQEGITPGTPPPDTAMSNRPTIAVLPFGNLGGRAEDESFVDGVHAEVLNQLYKIRSLEPRSLTSVLAYRDSPENMRSIAEELDVRYLVEGDVQRAGETIRIGVRLFDARADRRLWGDQYEERFTAENMLDVELGIAIDVATQAGAEILPGLRAQLAVEPPATLTAYERYLDGLYEFGTISLGATVEVPKLRESGRRAVEALEEAIAADPEWAPAHAAIGRVYHYLAGFGFEPSVNFPRSRSELDRALELDSLNAPAWASLGFVLHNWELEFEGAETAYRKASTLGWPNSGGYAVLLLSWGRFAEAIDAFERAISFTRSNITRGQLGWAHACAGDYGAAIEHLERLRRTGAPASPQRSAYLGYAYLKAGYREKGLAEVARMGENDPGKALAYALADSTARAEEFLRAAERAPPDWVMSSATVAAAVRMGDPDRALDYLERAVDQDPHGLLHVQCLEEVRSLEGNPRYEAVLDRVGFPPRERERE